MLPVTERHLALVRQGRNEWWRYLIGALIILLFVEVLAALPYLWLAYQGDEYSGLYVFVALNLGSLIGFAGLVITVVLIHRRSLLSLITPASRVDWRRVTRGFAVWFALLALTSLIEALLFPGRYRITFNPGTFFAFALAALCLTPLQTTFKELLFRGYVMQGLSLLTRTPLMIALVSSAIFMLPHLANPEVALNPLLLPPQYFLIGLLLAIVTLRDGRLELAIGIHAANNIFSGLIANYDDAVLTTEAIFTSQLDPVYSLVSLVPASVVAYLVLFRRRDRGEPEVPSS